MHTLSNPQINLLLRLVEADRRHQARFVAGLHTDPDERGVELGSITGHALSTALSLERAGLVEISDTRINCHKWAFLWSAQPAQPMEAT